MHLTLGSWTERNGVPQKPFKLKKSNFYMRPLLRHLSTTLGAAHTQILGIVLVLHAFSPNARA